MDNPKPKTAKKALLGIFAKQPAPGKCKTRLSPPLSLTEAAELYDCSLRETVTRMQADTSYHLVICYAGEQSWFSKQFPDLELLPQQGEDLGEKMANALHHFLAQGYQQVVLIGSDSPDLPTELIIKAIQALENAEVVLAPAKDGGYVLIGESKHYPQLFTDIAWSTEDVLPETQRRIKQFGIKSSLLESWEDLDDLASLKRFLSRSPETQTAQYLRQHLANLF